MNILVEGTRGKSGVVKMLVDAIESRGQSVVGKITGLEAAIFYKGKKDFVKRKNKKFLLDRENKKVLKKYKNVKFKVFENQALSPYTMRAFHLLFKPEIIVIPNIRYEHQDTLGESIEEQARSFAMNFKGARMVITTEQKESVLGVFRKYCKKYGVKLMEVKAKESVPGMQALYLIDAVLKFALGKGLTMEEKSKFKRELGKKISILYNKDREVYYFRGSKVNDIESTTNVYNFLKEKVDNKFCLVCYFRRDRSERTKAFIPFFKEIVKDKKIQKIFVSGHHIGNLPRHKKIVRVDEKDSEKILRYCRRYNYVIFTAINGVNPFMQEIELNLQGGKI